MRLLKIIYRKVVLHSKPIIPTILGLCLGLALSLVLSTNLDSGCSNFEGNVEKLQDDHAYQQGVNRKPNSVGEESFDYFNSDDFEPRLKPPKALNGAKQDQQEASKKILRPRYASTELAIKEKVFVGVITSKNTVDSFGTAINRTLSSYVSKLLFFMNSRKAELPSGLSVVIFSNEPEKLVPFHMVQYIADHYIKNYDWFYFIPDTTYVQGEHFIKYLKNLNVGTAPQYVGQSETTDEGQKCLLDSGVFLSQIAMNHLIKNKDWCLKNAMSDDHDVNFGKCVLQSIPNIACQTNYMGSPYKYFNSPDGFVFDKKIGQVTSNANFSDAVAVGNVVVDLDIYKLHRYFCELEINRTIAELEETQKNIKDITPSTPAGPRSLTWPIGVPAPSQPKTRFDILKWDYFTETHIFPDTDLSNIRPVKGVDKQDIQEVLKLSQDKLNKKHNYRLQYQKLLNGYRRFDPQRGMEYKLHLEMKDRATKETVHKEVHLMRPASYVELVPMPYVTESSRVNLILPVKAADRDDVVSFLDSYGHTCLDSGDNTHLFVVFIYDSTYPMNKEEDIFTVLKSMISFYETKYQNGARIAWTAIESNNPSQFTIMDAISRKFPKDTLFLICTVGMELSIEFLNRVRMNSIVGWQVFFPIGFWQYKPNLIYDAKPYPTEIEIGQKTGHFDANQYTHASFYNADYQYARKQMIATSASQNIDLFDMFLKYHNIHVLRAAEPALKIRYKELICEPTLNEDAYHRCLASRASGLASGSQLAMLIFESEQKVDKGHMYMMKQQNDPNVNQMKPNML